MRQSGHWSSAKPFTTDGLCRHLEQTIEELDVDQARREVLPFVRDPETLTVWSKDFFMDIIDRIRCR